MFLIAGLSVDSAIFDLQARCPFTLTSLKRTHFLLKVRFMCQKCRCRIRAEILRHRIQIGHWLILKLLVQQHNISSGFGCGATLCQRLGSAAAQPHRQLFRHRNRQGAWRRASPQRRRSPDTDSLRWRWLEEPDHRSRYNRGRHHRSAPCRRKWCRVVARCATRDARGATCRRRRRCGTSLEGSADERPPGAQG